MGKFRSSLAAKTVAVLIALISLVSCLASAVGMIFLDEMGFYSTGLEEMIEDSREAVCYKYSQIALAGYEEDFNVEELSAETNFRFGVIAADDLDKVDLTDPKSYVALNFDEIPAKDELYIYDMYIQEGESIYFGDHIWDPIDMSMDRNEYYYETMEYPVEGYYYDRIAEVLYVQSQDKLYPLYVNGLLTENAMYDGALWSCIEKDKEGADYQWKETLHGSKLESVVLDCDVEVLFDEIKIVDHKGLKKIGEVTDAAVMDIQEGVASIVEERRVPGQTYYVVSCVQTPLRGEETLSGGDMFIQTEILIRFCYRMRYLAPVIMLVSLLLFVLAFVFLMNAAGHHKGQEGVCRRLLDLLPIDLYFAALCVAEYAPVCLCLLLGNVLSWDITRVSSWVFVFCAGVLGILLFFAFCMSLAVNIKLGKWWRRTFLYWICKKCFRALRNGIRFIVSAGRSISHSITLFWKVSMILALLAIAEFAGIVSAAYDMEALLMLWLVEKIILYPAILFCLKQMHDLQEGAKRIANGDLDHQVDIKGMSWELKKHGRYLNDIGKGMNLAVNERLKSEHFKTELITNVSHDIKTPLTSIINYVDLLQKEQIDDPTVRDYLDVLHRQSSRLKKLIEDLMEASKASTGNLNVVMERCDAGVMLVQTVGEFEEKLMENQIELQIKKPEESVYIEADSRHLWRVFDNMMNNICKYSQSTTRAYVNLEQDGRQAVITFRNISKCQLNISSEELMERFVRGDSSRNTEGSGLGISIAKSLTELMDGTFELVVDGDLFKVILSFPLYGMAYKAMDKGSQRAEEDWMYGDSDSSFAQDGAKADTGWDRRARGYGMFHKLGQGMFRGIHWLGSSVKGIFHGIADGIRRIGHRNKRFLHNVKQAMEQTKAEEMAGADTGRKEDL